MRVLRIGVIGPSFRDSFADNIASGLEDLGHEPVLLGSSAPRLRRMGGPLNAVTVRWAQAERFTQRSLWYALGSTRLDAVISVEGALSPHMVAAVKDKGTKVALWFPDHIANLDRQLMLLAPYDVVCFKDPWIVDRLSLTDQERMRYLPEACNPRWHRPIEGARPVSVGKVVVVGNVYASRLRVLEALADCGIPIELYGPMPPKWLRDRMTVKHTHRYVDRESKAEVFRSAGAVLNTLYPAEIRGMNCRLFEAAASGGAVLTEWRDELPRLFEPGTEVASYSTFEELVETAQRLLEDPATARSMGDRASLRAHAEHTYAHRLEMLLSWLGF